MTWDTDCRFCSATGRTDNDLFSLRSAPVTASFRGLAAHEACAAAAEVVACSMWPEATVNEAGVIRWATTNSIPTDDSLATLEVLGLIDAAQADANRAARRKARGRRPSFGRGVPTATIPAA